MCVWSASTQKSERCQHTWIWNNNFTYTWLMVRLCKFCKTSWANKCTGSNVENWEFISDKSNQGWQELTFKRNGLRDVFGFDVLLLIDNEHIPILLQSPAIFVNPLLNLIFCKDQTDYYFIGIKCTVWGDLSSRGDMIMILIHGKDI